MPKLHAVSDGHPHPISASISTIIYNGFSFSVDIVLLGAEDADGLCDHKFANPQTNHHPISPLSLP